MIRKLTIALLAGAMCLTAASLLLAVEKKDVAYIYPTLGEYEKITGKKIKEYGEAPMLKEMVDKGNLPPVEERLPEEPLVIDPAEEIGRYGGAFRAVHRGKKDDYYCQHVIYETPVVYASNMYAPDCEEPMRPNIFKSWTVSDDVKVYTFKIRKGMKWSDGDPFDADDFAFWYEDVACNKELTPGGVAQFKVGGEMAKFEKIDDYTIRYTFAGPYGIFIEKICRGYRIPGRIPCYLPSHFMKKFHPKYTSKDDLKKAMEKEGFGDWKTFFQAKTEFWTNPDTPTMCAWKPVNKITEPIHRFVRNPYYWKIDTEGNQLPYLDELHYTLVPDEEGMLMKTLAGEVDSINEWQIGLAQNLPILMEHQQKGDYTVKFMQSWLSSIGVIHFNFSHPDPVLREILNNKKFRIALSMAMNRKEINDLLFNGVYDPVRVRPPGGPPYHGELPRFNQYANYDVGLANQLLDGMGLKWDKDHKFRLRPDGKPLNLTASVDNLMPAYVRVAEMYKKYWEDIGVNLTVKSLDRAFWTQQLQSNRHDLAIRDFNPGGLRPKYPATLAEWVPISTTFNINPAWGLWMVSGGQKGEEPPADIKRLKELHDQFIAEPDEKKRNDITNEIYLTHCENMWVVGAVWSSGKKSYQVFSNRLGNLCTPPSANEHSDQPCQYFIKK